MSNEKLYIIYRVYNKKDRPDNDVGPILYGWSNNKNVVKAFMNQRDKNKYYVEKMSDANINEIMEGSYNDLDVNNMIDYIKLRSSKTHEEICFFMTSNEMQEVEKRIQRYFRDLCSISNIIGNGKYLEMYMYLDRYYIDALELIGYRPPEISVICQSADYRDDPGDIVGITMLIEDAYSGVNISPSEIFEHRNKLPGLSTLYDISSKILYSIESFIKVMIDDL